MVAYVRNGGRALMAELPSHDEARRRASIYHRATMEASGTNSIRYTVHADVLFPMNGESIQVAHDRLDALMAPFSYKRARDYRANWKLGNLCVNIDITGFTDEDIEGLGFTFLK